MPKVQAEYSSVVLSTNVTLTIQKNWPWTLELEALQLKQRLFLVYLHLKWEKDNLTLTEGFSQPSPKVMGLAVFYPSGEASPCPTPSAQTEPITQPNIHETESLMTGFSVISG